MSSDSAKLEGKRLLTEEEARAAKAEINEGVEDEFEDALDENKTGVPDGSGNFEVSIEELSILRAELACEFPEDYKYFSDQYIISVASKPYSKDPTVRRPIEYTMEKLTNVMEWREQAGAPELIDLVHLANGPETAPEAVEQPARLAEAKAISTSLNTGSFYWHGFTKDGHPILWLRTNRKPWYPDVDADVKSLILLADAGISSMPKHITDFVVVSDSSSPPPPNPSFMIAMLKALVRGYPDRLKMIVSAPISSIVQFVMKLLLPLMPGRLSSKVQLMDSEKAIPKLEELLLNGKDDIPTFFGGTADHDKFYPEETTCPNRGTGSLKFDFFGMVERLEQARKDYEAQSSK